MEACFRTTRCPGKFKTTFGTSMFRGVAKRLWIDLLAIKGSYYPDKITWEEFKVEFFKNFRSKAEVERLKTKLQNTRQKSMDLITFRAHFIDRFQFSPEYVSNEMSKCRLFHSLLRDEIRKRIIISQFHSFTALFDAARYIDDELTKEGIIMQNKESYTSKRRFEQNVSPSKKIKCGEDMKSGGGEIPLCVCFNCGKPSHIAKNCGVAIPRSIICFHCNHVGHKKVECPLLSKSERKEEHRKEVIRRIEKSEGTPRGRSLSNTDSQLEVEIVSGKAMLFVGV
ncbi:uncharacterized protein [Rutidosis leptorrhynchoides]|uniref:uncharacterized protein n=1 Tax=Rutidosis leptorrhynchoides TaxID=125765 RepID=UPI003A993701